MTASALLNVSIDGANDSPVSNPYTAALEELATITDGHYGQVTGNVLANDADSGVGHVSIG